MTQDRKDKTVGDNGPRTVYPLLALGTLVSLFTMYGVLYVPSISSNSQLMFPAVAYLITWWPLCVYLLVLQVRHQLATKAKKTDFGGRL